MLCAAESAAACCNVQAEGAPSSRSVPIDKALDVVQVAAPVKGEVQPWVWLLRALADRFSTHDPHAGVHYLVRGPNSLTHRRYCQIHLPGLYMTRQPICTLDRQRSQST